MISTTLSQIIFKKLLIEIIFEKVKPFLANLHYFSEKNLKVTLNFVDLQKSKAASCMPFHCQNHCFGVFEVGLLLLEEFLKLISMLKRASYSLSLIFFNSYCENNQCMYRNRKYKKIFIYWCKHLLKVLQIQDVYTGSQSKFFHPGSSIQGQKYPGSRIWIYIKSKYCKPKITSVADPESVPFDHWI